MILLNCRRFLSAFKGGRLYPSFNNLVKAEWSQSGTMLYKHDLIFPVFVSDVKTEFTALAHLPLNYRVGNEKLLLYLDPLIEKGLGSVLLFGTTHHDHKDPTGTFSSSPHNPIIQAVKNLRASFPHLNIICDVCLCAYTSTGECYIEKDGEIDLEFTIQRLTETALAYATAGCDIVAPSDMIDNRVKSIRKALKGCKSNAAIMSYASKFSSAFYGPFRSSCDSAFQGCRRKNQLPIGSKTLALRGIERDIMQGSDFIITKPGLNSLDILSEAKRLFPNHHFFPYHVSGECAMLHYGSENGSLDLQAALYETMVSFKRAGATGIITYMAPQVLDSLSIGHEKD